jgi:hypothetical protein
MAKGLEWNPKGRKPAERVAPSLVNICLDFLQVKFIWAAADMSDFVQNQQCEWTDLMTSGPCVIIVIVVCVLLPRFCKDFRGGEELLRTSTLSLA